jgi:hypothetical protein
MDQHKTFFQSKVQAGAEDTSVKALAQPIIRKQIK